MADKVISQIREIAGRYNIKKIILFGSRARGDYSPGSDYDIAVFGGALSAFDKAGFSDAVGEIETLHKIDIVFVDDCTDDGLLRDIEKEGVTIYGQTGDEAGQF